MKLRVVSVNYIIKLLKFELKEPFFLYYHNLVLQDEIFYMAYQSLFLLFYI